MKTFFALQFALALFASPSQAFSVDISMPILTWPEEAPPPVTQTCVDPAQLGTPDCATAD